MKPKFVVIVCVQGQPNYYFYNSLSKALICFIRKYKRSVKYGTSRVSLRQVFETDSYYKNWINGEVK